jgi:3'(2'), 5'-bisphosphate nucleotidase
LSGALLPPLAEAARVILETRHKGLTVDRKSDDSPVTEADRRAEEILTDALRTICPEIPVVAEEAAASGADQRVGDRFFLLDPLDGTRDYAAGRDDFTVNIGLIEDGHPVYGLIYAPAKRELFLTAASAVAVAAKFEPGQFPQSLSDLNASQIRVRTGQPGHLHALVSRRESGNEFDERLAALGISERRGMSSAIKFGLLARGEADLYPRFGPTCEWDTAAGQAIVEAAGGSVTALDGSPLIYGKSGSKFLNGPFVARGILHR